MNTHRHPTMPEIEDHEHAVRFTGRSRRRAALFAALIAAAVIVVESRADASAAGHDAFATGQATMTSQANCPEGLVLDLLLHERDDGTWSLLLHPVHAGCVVRTDLPVEFVGDWDPSGIRRCHPHTGQGCLRSVDDPTEIIGLGPVAEPHVLTRTEIVYEHGRTRLSGSALIRRGSVRAPPPMPTIFAGLGEVTPPGCSSGAYKVPFTLANDGGEVWILTRIASAAVQCPAATYAGPSTLIGRWDPETGGCLSSASGMQACIGAMRDRGLANGVPFTWCSLAGCSQGAAWLAHV